MLIETQPESRLNERWAVQTAYIKLIIIASHSLRQDVPHGHRKRHWRRSHQKALDISCHGFFCPPGCATLVWIHQQGGASHIVPAVWIKLWGKAEKFKALFDGHSCGEWMCSKEEPVLASPQSNCGISSRTFGKSCCFQKYNLKLDLV